jgi:hypothetical protein
MYLDYDRCIRHAVSVQLHGGSKGVDPRGNRYVGQCKTRSHGSFAIRGHTRDCHGIISAFVRRGDFCNADIRYY